MGAYALLSLQLDPSPCDPFLLSFAVVTRVVQVYTSLCGGICSALVLRSLFGVLSKARRRTRAAELFDLVACSMELLSFKHSLVGTDPA